MSYERCPLCALGHSGPATDILLAAPYRIGRPRIIVGRPGGGDPLYDTFISYSHAKDKPLVIVIGFQAVAADIDQACCRGKRQRQFVSPQPAR